MIVWEIQRKFNPAHSLVQEYRYILSGEMISLITEQRSVARDQGLNHNAPQSSVTFTEVIVVIFH